MLRTEGGVEELLVLHKSSRESKSCGAESMLPYTVTRNEQLGPKSVAFIEQEAYFAFRNHWRVFAKILPRKQLFSLEFYLNGPWRTSDSEY